MDHDGWHRRHFLCATTLAITSSIAGCSDSTNNPNNPDLSSSQPPDSDNTEPDGPTNNVPEEPAAIFDGYGTKFNFFDLPYYEGAPDSLHPHPMNRSHPDNRLFTVTVADENTANVTIENINVKRTINIILNVRDKDGQYHRISQNIHSREDAESTFTTRELEFDLSNINIPHGSGGFIELLAEDSDSGYKPTSVLKFHQFVGIPYKNGTNWVNAETFNVKRYRDSDGNNVTNRPSGVTGDRTTDSEPAGYVETRDPQEGDGEERIVFLAVRNAVNSEIYGVSAHIKHEPYDAYHQGSEQYQRYHNIDYESYYATEISHLRELAKKTSKAITKIGLTNPLERLEALGDLGQMLPYYIHDGEPGPTTALYECRGDCTQKSAVFCGIAMNDPWNIMPGLVYCEINGLGHQTPAIDVRDINDSNIDSQFTVKPTDKQIRVKEFPDTEFSFFDMTFDSEIGERTNGVNNIRMYDLGDYSRYRNQYSIAPEEPSY